MRAKTAIDGPLWAATASGSSYHPSMVNRRKIEYTLRAGFPNNSGTAGPKRNVVNMLNTTSSTIRAIVTINEALNALLMPSSSLFTLGINLSSRNVLKARNVLKDSRMFVPGNSTPKIFAHEGRASTTKMKSKRFQPSAQYFPNPAECILTTASVRKSRVNRLSMTKRDLFCSDRKPLINIMLVLMKTSTSIIWSLVKKRLMNSIYT